MPLASENFSWGELLGSREHPELVTSFDQLPRIVVYNLARLVFVHLQPLRRHVGGVLTTSGYRGPALSAAVRGPHASSRPSTHESGRAVDYVLLEADPADVWRALVLDELEGVEFDRLAIYPDEESSRFHADIRPLESGPMRRLLYAVEAGEWRRVTVDEALKLPV